MSGSSDALDTGFWGSALTTKTPSVIVVPESPSDHYPSSLDRLFFIPSGNVLNIYIKEL